MRVGLVVAMLAATLACSTAQPRGDEANPLAGGWRLVGWERRSPDGEVVQPFGPTPGGQLVYTPDGRVSLHLLDPARPPFESGVFLKGTDDEVRAAFQGYFGYFGRYSLEGDPLASSGVVTHHVEGSAFPNYAGIDRVWSVTIRGRVLTLETVPDPNDPPGPTYRVVWERPMEGSVR